MDIKRICDAIEQEVEKTELTGQSYKMDLQLCLQEIEKSRQRSQSIQALQTAEYDRQAATIQVYLNQIPTNIRYIKRSGRESPLNESLLTQMALTADRSGRVDDYEKLYEAAMGMMNYVQKSKSTFHVSAEEIQRREAEYSRNESRYRNQTDAAYQKIFRSENYLALVKGMADARQNLRGFLGTSELLIGRRYTGFHFPVEYHAKIKADFGNCFDEAEGRLLIPYYTDISRGFRILIKSDGNLQKLDETVEGLLYSLLCTGMAESYEIQYIDGVRMTGGGVGKFQRLLSQKNRLFLKVPGQESELDECLEKVMERCRKIEELLLKEGKGSLYEWNISKQKEGQKKLLLMVLEGFPSYYPRGGQERIRQLLANGDRWGVSFIIAVEKRRLEQANKGIDDFTMAYGLDGFMKMSCPSNNIQFTRCSNIGGEFTDRFLLKENENVSTTKYMDWIDLHKKPDYENSAGPEAETKRYPIRLPVGVDEDGSLYEIEFGKMGFAGYLMGGAGSGKSSLIHTLIASILYRYHPDDVELWLVDFKMAEFAQYIGNMPPHVKYIVLDYSPKVVCDLLDRLIEELTKRAVLFAKHPEWQGNIDNVPVSEGLPRIFLIVDEFEKMAKILTNSSAGVDVGVYRKKISSLLQEGRAYGFRILFASQNYESGVNILEDNARNNIDIRIAMKNKSVKEMKAVLNLQGEALSEYEDKLTYLPPHQLFIAEEDRTVCRTYLHQLQSLWISDNREIQHLLSNLNRYFVPASDDKKENIRQYFWKDPVVISGKQLNSFEELEKKLWQRAEQSRKESCYYEEDVPVFLGNLQAMDNRRPIWVTQEKNENICILSSQIYAPYAASVVLSTVKCFENAGISVMVIGYRRNPVYARYQKNWLNYRHTDDPATAESWLYRVTKALRTRTSKPMLIVICGITEIAEEAIAEREERERRLEERTQREQKIQGKEGGEWTKAKTERFGEAQTGNESNDLKLLMREAAESMGKSERKRLPGLSGNWKADKNSPTPDGAAGDIWENISYIQKHGSRWGVHLLTVAGAVQELGNRSKVQPDYYNHLLSFKIPFNDSIARLKAAVNIGAGDDFVDDSICAYSGKETFTFRPFLHKGITWDGWNVDENGKAWKP